MKHKNHNNIVKNYKLQKQMKLIQLANQLLKNDEKTQLLKKKKLKSNILDLF